MFTIICHTLYLFFFPEDHIIYNLDGREKNACLFYVFVEVGNVFVFLKYVGSCYDIVVRFVA